jgi:RIO kinase 1
MKTPARLASLLEDGLIDEVLRQLMSGKEATVYVVRCGEEVRCAKVYKEANKRSFRQSVDYTEGRRVKNSRQGRAMAKGSKFGRESQEAAWQSAEVDALYQLADAGVSVPVPYNFYEGVLLMELVVDADGHAAPRLNDISLTAEQARLHHQGLIQEVVRMLCAGIVHGDLSEFNILMSERGPVIIDLPQAVDAAANNNAREMLERDVNNLKDYFVWIAKEEAEKCKTPDYKYRFIKEIVPVILHLPEDSHDLIIDQISTYIKPKKAFNDELKQIKNLNGTIIHCPNSNRLLGNSSLNLEYLDGINLAMGTDGLSSNYTLNLFDEIVFL